MEYIGEVIPQTEFLRRTREYDAEGFKHYYFMTLKNDEVSTTVFGRQADRQAGWLGLVGY